MYKYIVPDRGICSGLWTIFNRVMLPVLMFALGSCIDVQRGSKVTSLMLRGRWAQHLHDTRVIWRICAYHLNDICDRFTPDARHIHQSIANVVRTCPRGARNKEWTPLCSSRNAKPIHSLYIVIGRWGTIHTKKQKCYFNTSVFGQWETMK
jgi:hypothetical protein